MKSISEVMNKDKKLKILSLIFISIVILMPVHGFLSTVVGSITSQVELAKAWKEVLLIFALLVMISDWLNHKKLASKLFRDRLNQLVLVYALLYVISYAYWRTDFDAAVVSVLVNIRFLAIFILAQWLRLRYGDERLAEFALRYIILISGFVSVFAIAQVTILPSDFLENFGYGVDTIPASHTLDDNETIIRAASTTRGPNALGAFLALPLSWIVWQFFKKPSSKVVVVGLIGAGALFFTYSRSGWLASFIAIVIIALLGLPRKWKKVLLGAGLPALAVLLLLLFSNASSSASLSRLLLHDDPETGKITSNKKRFDATERAFKQIKKDPLGRGPGTAGAASFYNDDQRPRIPENYYLQIGQEVGVIGIALFVAISSAVGVRLFRKRKQMLPRVLLATLAGVSVAALFTQAWGDEEIALVWWGLAGFFVSE